MTEPYNCFDYVFYILSCETVAAEAIAILRVGSLTAHLAAHAASAAHSAAAHRGLGK